MSTALSTTAVLRRSFRAMASSVTLAVVAPGARSADAVQRAEAVVREVERTCSRFDPSSALSRANAEPDRWHRVPATLAAAVQEALVAHHDSCGLFDPRVHDVLVGWGYDRSLAFDGGAVTTSAHPLARSAAASAGGPAAKPPATPPAATSAAARGEVAAPARWEAEVVRRAGASWLHLRGRRIDLGGIGKGLAVRWAAAELEGAGDGFLVDAGGDGVVCGRGPERATWRVAVEDPFGRDQPLLVLDLTGTAYATSSTRLRSWRADGRTVHHLVDPRTGRPGGSGLLAVTVVATDAARAEVLAKALFLAGADTIEDRVHEAGPAAAWVTTDRRVVVTPELQTHVVWRPDHG